MRAVTHDGSFHADDVLCWTLLSRLFPHAELERTRSEDSIAAADIVFDVGMVFDPGSKRFDHHMRGRPLREDGTPYSAFGLIWAHCGRDYVRSLQQDDVERIWTDVDETFVVGIDRLDNGIGQPSSNDVSSLIESFNAAWDQEEDNDQRFHAASEWAAIVLESQVGLSAARQRAMREVQAAADSSADPRILELNRGMPWQDAVFDLGLEELLFVVSPNNDFWYAKAVPPEPKGFGQRLGLPDEWRGLKGNELAQACGVEDAEFCHAAGFIAAARSRAGIMAMVDACLRSNDLEPIAQAPTPRADESIRWPRP